MMCHNTSGNIRPAMGALAKRRRNCISISLYVEWGLMEKQSVEYYEKAKGLSIPVNTISDEMLQTALDKAIREENYEMASHLRDEINRRKHKE